MADLGIEGIGSASLLDGGASATVFAATRQAFGDRVAIKVLKHTITDDTSRRHFESEVRALQELAEVPGIVAALDSGLTIRGEPYLVLPLLDRSTQAAIDDDGPYPWSTAVDMIVHAANAVEGAHAMGIFHRDLKPANLLLTKSNDVFVSDFGIALLTHSSLSMVGAGYTAAYAAPEQIEGHPITPATDQHGLAATLVGLITGAAPFGATNGFMHATLRAVLEDAPPDLTPYDVPPSVQAVIARAMSKNPEDRYPSAAGFADALSQQAVSVDTPPTAAHGDAQPDQSDATTDSLTSATVIAARPAAAGDHASVPSAPDEPTANWKRFIPIGTLAVLVVAALTFFIVTSGSGQDPDQDRVVATAVPDPTSGLTGTAVSTTDEPTDQAGSRPEADQPAPTIASRTPDAEPNLEPSPDSFLILPDGSGDFADLTAATEEAPAGSTLLLGPGTFLLDSTLLIDREFDVAGQGTQTILRRESEGVVVLIANTTASFRDLVVESAFETNSDDRSPVVVFEASTIDVSGITVRFGAGDGVFVFGATGTISTSTFLDNGWSGIAFGGDSDIDISSSVAQRNDAGFAWIENALGTATDNMASENSGAGFAVSGEAAPTIETNTAMNGADGFLWSEASGGTATGNEARDNNNSGYLIMDNAGPDLSANQAIGNNVGFSWSDDAAGSASDNTAVANPGAAFLVQDSAAPVLMNNTEQ